MSKQFIKYAALTICGLALFWIINSRREIPAIGGEMFFIILPVLWWLFETTAKDAAQMFIDIWRGK